MRNTLLAVAVLAALAAPAQADEGKFAFGVGAGRANYDFEPTGYDDHATAWKVFAGYHFNPWLGAELAYIDGGEITDSVGDLSAKLSADIVQASLVGSWWPHPNFGPYARISANQWDAKLTLSNGVTSERIEDDGTEFSWGLGLQGIYDRALFRLEYEAAEYDNTVDGTLISLSIVWRL